MQCPDVHANSVLTFRFSALYSSSKFYLTARMDTLLTNTKYCRFRFNFYQSCYLASAVLTCSYRYGHFTL